MYKILIVDLETENKPWYGQVASPFNPENYIVAPGWRVDTVQDDGSITVGETHFRYFDSVPAADAGGYWFDVLDECTLMVCHNAGFEIKWFLSKYRERFENFIRRGGRVLDTQMAEYLISHQTELYPSLDETAPKYGGTHKIDGVKILWQQGALTSEIDKDLLIEYLAGPSGDIDNTAIAFYGQMQKLLAAGMWRMFLERCDSVLAFAYCEWFGLFVNRDVAEKNRLEQEAEIARMTAELHKLLPVLPEGCEFSWSSRFHVSALVYGGPVRYRHKVPYDPPQYEKQNYWKNEAGQRWQAGPYGEPPVDALIYKAGKNKGMAKVFREDTDVEKLKWEDAQYHLPGLVQLTKLPEVVRSKFLGKRAEFRGSQMLCDGVTPVYSTSGDALKGIAALVPEVALMTALGTLEKDTGTYYMRTDENGKVSGMLQYVGPDDIVHHSLNTAATVTTRLSSSNPNLQNLPRADEDNAGVAKSKVKEMFTSRFGSDGRIIEVDYSALEVVMLCAMTGDTDLLALLQAGTDMHSYRLAFKLGEKYEDVKAAVDTKSHPDHNRYKVMRSDIKPLSFADQYGASPEGLAFNTGCSIEDAIAFQDNEMKLFPISRGFRSVIAKEVERTGSEPTGLHREMMDGGAWRVYRRGYYQAPSGTCYSFRQQPTWDRETRREVMAYKPTQMANYPFQGEAGFMMSLSMGRIVRHMIKENWYNNQVCLINNVHDAAYLDAANPDVGRTAALAVKAIMEDAPRYMTEIWPAYNMANIPFPAAAEMGTSMQHKDHIHE